MKKHQLYLESSKIALNNSSRLYQESKLLLDNDHFARGFSLCVLTIEELSKAFLYRCVSANLIDESKTRKFVKDHKKKITQSASILTFAVFITEHLMDLVNALEHDKTKPDHKDHTYPTELTKAAFSSIKKTIETLYGTHEKRLDCLYVDIREGKIIDPNQLIEPWA
jgi:AbiV family abortive infection protein